MSKEIHITFDNAIITLICSIFNLISSTSVYIFFLSGTVFLHY